MRQVTSRLSPDLIDAIGPAPKVGRDRWYEIAQQLEKKECPPGNQSAFSAEIAEAARRGLPSDARFTLLETKLRQTKTSPSRSSNSASALGKTITKIGAISVSPRLATITVARKDAAALHQWIAEHPNDALNALHEAQQKSEQQ